MVLWNLFVFATSVILLAEGTFDNCNNGLLTDKILKITSPHGNVSVWDINEVIVFGEQESGKLSLILPKQFSIKLEKVDRTFLNVFVLKPIRDDYFHNVVIEYIVSKEWHPSLQFDLQSIHLKIVDDRSGQSKDLILLYDLRAEGQQTSKILLAPNKRDPKCQRPAVMDTIHYSQVFVQNAMRNRSHVSSGSRCTIAFLLNTNGDFENYVTSKNDEIRILNYTKIINANEYAYILVEFETLKPGKAEFNVVQKQISNKKTREFYGVPITIVPGFIDFWKSSEFSNENLNPNEQISIFKTFLYDPTENKALSFDGNEEVININRPSTNYSELVFVFKTENKHFFQFAMQSQETGIFYRIFKHDSNTIITIPFDGIRNELSEENLRLAYCYDTMDFYNVKITTDGVQNSNNIVQMKKKSTNSAIESIWKLIPHRFDYYDVTDMIYYEEHDHGLLRFDVGENMITEVKKTYFKTTLRETLVDKYPILNFGEQFPYTNTSVDIIISNNNSKVIETASVQINGYKSGSYIRRIGNPVYYDYIFINYFNSSEYWNVDESVGGIYMIFLNDPFRKKSIGFKPDENNNFDIQRPSTDYSDLVVISVNKTTKNCDPAITVRSLETGLIYEHAQYFNPMVFSIRFDGIRNELPVEHLSIERFDTVYHVKITNKHVSIGYTSEVNSVFNGVWEKQENACTAVAEVGVHKYYINGETIILEEKQSGSLIFDVPKNAIVTILISSSKCSDLDVNREFANKFSYQVLENVCPDSKGYFDITVIVKDSNINQNFRVHYQIGSRTFERPQTTSPTYIPVTTSYPPTTNPPSPALPNLIDFLNKERENVNFKYDSTELAMICSYEIFENGTTTITRVLPVNGTYTIAKYLGAKTTGIAFFINKSDKTEAYRLTEKSITMGFENSVTSENHEGNEWIVTSEFQGERKNLKEESLIATLENLNSKRKTEVNVQVKAYFKSFLDAKFKKLSS
ncbi:uncharacterized protein CELE_C45G9.10 [Caenorhabditis elegans]|uniref:Uncharacterized protein C45G9.10 n=2 Tax=Caenorhabditis elegans TaxID=6239 RepID=YQIA_CAEEL|nr:Uncharacterized protein CELE_C45G9.10 [Caenorhabditis elegans]Q09281.1 RecName: Full=Uncharacterized protein C45G9.10 [Caenorhabditis elegans]CCD67398.1 Uncharacterized protein CELE_C45G9.10 [Caenorhabditis elegans]|eukprot:NP_741127.1 Uncharacterized protein CELE_C45G9.10 [Caenorhabditis elegans]